MLLTSWLRELCRGRVRVHSSTARRSNRLAQSLAPAVIALESRVLLSNVTLANTYTVTNTNDSGTGSLRYEVGLANADGQADTIKFDPTVFATPQTITLTTGQINLNDVGGLSITGPTAGVTISGNNASRVFQVDHGSIASLTGLTITRGSAGNAYGGGLYIAGTASLTSCIVSGNAAQHGGGIFTGSAASVTLTNTTVSNNSVSNAGAGLCDFDTSVVLTITNCTFSSNSAVSGGGIYTEGTTTLTNSTLSGNTVSNVGAGAVFKYGVATLTNVTISGNAAIANTGGLYAYSSNVTLNNSIVARNTYNGSVPSDIGGSGTNTVVAGNNNLIGTGGSGNLQNGVNGNLVYVANPLLAPLGNYGGSIQTMALLPGSLAIDAGKNSLAIGSTDERGEPYVGTVDIGAFESQGFTLATVTGSTPQTTNQGTAFPNPLGLTVMAKNPIEPVNGGIVTFTPPSSGPTAIVSSPTSEIAGGVASVAAMANSAPGTYTVSASANGAVSQTFSLNNVLAPGLIVNTTSDVVNPDDSLTSLREAIAYANTFTRSAPTITFDPTVFANHQTITLAGTELLLTDTAEPITINAPVAGLTISGNHTSRVFEIYSGATGHLNGLTITGGNAGSDYGGGVYVSGTVTLANCVVTGNIAGQGGGGVDGYSGGSVTLTNTTVSNNTSYYGGGLFVGSGSSLAMIDCTVSGNTATSVGGGLNGSGTMNLVNSTFSGNTAVHVGGGIAIGYSNATLTNLTITGNSAQIAGGGLYDYRANITLNNTIVAGNTHTGGASDISGNKAVAGSNNLIGTGGSDGLVNGSNGNQVGVAKPLLAPLGNYGGATQTIALLPGSPAIDAGKNSLAIGTTDQRGKPYVGTVDIGAFQSQGFTLTPVAGSTPQSTLRGAAFANPLAVTVTPNNPGEPVNGGVVNYTVPGSGASATLVGNPATIASGTASVTATANSTLGSYNVTTTASGVATPATFQLENAEKRSLIVNTTSDSSTPYDNLTSLREAIAYANTFTSSAPTITFDPTVFATAQTITLSGGELFLTDISEPITINAPAAGLTVSGNNTSRVFEVIKNASANLIGLTITGGYAVSAGNDSGGGVYDYEGSVSLTNCTVTGNTAHYGGGILVYGKGSVATLTNSTVSNNSANRGGGAYASYGGSLTLLNSTVSKNSSYNGGGVAAYHDSSITVTNCTVSGNSGSKYGAGITVANNSYGTLTNVTVSGNTAATGGGSGLYVLNNSYLSLLNTIVAGNTNGDIVVTVASNVSGSNNLIGTGNSDELVNGVNGNIVGVANPLLAPLGNYGGPTQTMALLPGSPAIDAGSNSLAVGTTDQRGKSYVGNVDIGAFESQGFTLTPVSGSTPQTAVAGNLFANPLGVTVTANNPVEPVNGGLINFTVPLIGPSATLTSTPASISGGQASVKATANLVLGGFNATASTTEGTTATFVLNNIIPLALSGLGGTVTYLQGGSPVQVAPALVVTQNLGLNITSATVLFGNLQVGDRINFSNPFGLQHSFLQSPDGTSATLIFTGASSAANYQATLRSVVFSCVATVPGTSLRSTAFIVSDTIANSASGSQTIGVTLVSQPPLLSGIEATPLTYIANYPTYPAQIITNTLSAFDADSNNLTRAKVQITSGYQNNSSSHDLLSFTPQFGLASSFDPVTGTLTLTGSTSLTNYRIALRSVTFSSSGPAANGTTRTISFTVYDDSTPTPLASNTVARNVNMQLAAAPPTLSGLNGTTTFIKGGSPVPIASSIVVNQPSGLNLGGAVVTFTNLQPGDRFDFFNQFALQHSMVFSPDATSATLTISGYATPAQYQTTLQSIIFWNVAGNLLTSPRAASFVVSDASGQPSAPGVQYFTVAPSNQPPVLSGIEQTPLVYQANHPEFPPQQVTSTLLVTDPVSANLTRATVQITSGYQNNTSGHDVLSFVNQNGISGTFNAATGTLTLSGLSSVSNYGVALRSVTFSTSGSNIAAGTRIVTFTAFDETMPTPLASNQMSRSVLVTTTNASPVLSGLSPVSIYTKGSPPLLFAQSLQVVDVDSPVLNGTTISFTNWQSGDRLSFYNQFALQHTFTEDLVAHTASLTITGSTSVSNYQTMLRSIGYYSVAGLPSLATRNVSIVVNDGHSNSNIVTGSINFQP